MAEAKVYYHTTAKGSRIFVEECGSGPLMVLMHGFDFPGSGFSTFKLPPSIPQFEEVLIAVLESRAKKEVPILVGHSLGSIIAMHYASQYPTKALILIGPGRSSSHIPAAVERMTSLAAKARKGIEGIRDSTIANNVAPSSSDIVRAFVRQVISQQTSEGYAATCEAACAQTHIDPDYSAIKCPVLLIAGDQDNISPLSRTEELKDLIGAGNEKRNVAVAVVHSGHQQVLEDTEGVLKAMESVLVLI